MQEEKKRWKKSPEEREEGKRRRQAALEANRFTSNQSRTAAAENGRKGGIATGKAKRERKSIKELCADLLTQEAPDEFIRQAFPEGAPEDRTWYALIVAQQARQAAAGNTKAAVFIRDSAGDQPTTKVQADIGLTDADRQLMDRIDRRLSAEKDANISSSRKTEV